MKKIKPSTVKVHSSAQVKRYTRSKFGNFMFFFFLFLFGAFSVLPLVYSIVTSFKPLDELLVFPPSLITVKRPTLDNYLILPSLIESLEVPFSIYFFNSLFVTIVGTVLHVLASSSAAFVLSKSNIKFKKTIFLVIQLSLLFNAYTLAIPRYLIYSEMGIIDTLWAYILPAIPSSMGVFLMKQYMDGYVPDTLIEAAKIDGAGWIRTFWSIVFPCVKPCLLTLTLFSFRDMWTIVPSGTIFTETLKTLPMVMSTVVSGGLARSGAAMANSVLMMIPPIIVYFISQGSLKESMSSAGIKG